jgi:chromosome segregation ATPase
VREHLGTGSKSTIAPLLKRWRSDHDSIADVSGLPNDLVNVVKSLHERVQQMADQRIDQAQQTFQDTNDELRKALAEARHTMTQLNAQQHDLEQRIQSLIEEKDTLSRSIEDMRVSAAKTESQRDNAQL